MNSFDDPQLVEDEIPFVEAKVAVIGDMAAGKSTLLGRIKHKRYVDTKATQGADQIQTDHTGPNSNVPLKIHWRDVGGQRPEVIEKGRSHLEKICATEALRGAHAVLLVVDVTRENWREEAEKRVKDYLLPTPQRVGTQVTGRKSKVQAKTSAPDPTKVTNDVYLVITKKDEIKDLDKQQSGIEDFARQHGLKKIFYTSAKNENDVEVDALVENVVYRCLEKTGNKPNGEEDTTHNTPPAPVVVSEVPTEIKVNSGAPNMQEAEIAKNREIAKFVARLIPENFEKLPTREQLITRIKELNSDGKMTVIDKLKIIEAMFARLKQLVEQRAEPDPKQFWFASHNLKYKSHELDFIETLKQLYEDHIAVEPWSTRNKDNNLVVNDEVNRAIREHVGKSDHQPAGTQGARDLIDFQRTQYKFFKTDTTSTRKRLDLLVEGAGRPNASIAALRFKYHR